MKTAHLTWESKLVSNAWRITGPEDLRIPFRQPRLPWNRPKPLSALSADVRFRALLSENPPFANYWARATGGYGGGTIRLIFHAGEKYWRLPWELLLEDFDEKRMERVVITRGDGDTRIIQPSEFADPLRVQVVLGDNSGQRGARLRLEEERAKLTEIYGGLETGVRDNVKLLDCAQPTLDELPELLKQRRPDVLWFSGHGLPHPPAFCLRTSNGKIRDLTPALLAQFIRETGIRPIYVIFLACHLGLGGEAEQFGSAPEFFKALVPCDVQGMLIMQGAINDNAAVRLATALFRHLAVGRPLDWAVASARHIVRQAMADETGSSVEWARPAVWSSGEPPDELSLNFANSGRARRQVAARQVLRARLTAPAELDVVADAASCARAKGWLGLTPPHLQLVGTPQHAAGQTLWIRLLLALQSVCSHSVIAIELDCEDTARALRIWAEAVQNDAARWYEPFLRSTDLVPQMLDDPQKAWPELCATEGIVIAIRDDYEQRELEPWFLTPLEKRAKALTLLWRTKPLPAAWPVEPLDMQPSSQQQLSALAQDYQPLLNSMAVVGMPVRESWLRGAELTKDLQKEIGQVLVDTEAGIVLNATASAHFASAMNEEDRKEAHFDCMRILNHPDVRLRAPNPAVRLLRLRHCLAAQQNKEAVKECQLALAEMRQLDRPWRALEIGASLEHLHRIFPPIVSLHLAWAGVMTGDLNVGKTWLKRAKEVESPLEKAWYHGLEAEVAKSEGKKQKALEEIERAIAIVEGQPLEGRDGHLVQLRRYAYRQDRARIYQYLFYEHAKARQEYEKLQEELADGSEPHLLAAVRRNYSECLRSMATGIGDADWKRAKDIVDEEIGKLANEPEVPIYAELLYERARIALKENDRAAADDYLQRCLQAAERSRFAMIRAIAGARRFWEFKAFDLAEWQRLESQLNVHHRHGWAVRSAMNGRLRAAKRLEQSNPAAALELLRRNVEKAGANPGFDGRSDLERIAQSYAGLAVVSGDPGQWNSFIKTHLWAGDWIGHDASRNAAQLWKGVH
jgi:hypothetical protein